MSGKVTVSAPPLGVRLYQVGEMCESVAMAIRRHVPIGDEKWQTRAGVLTESRVTFRRWADELGREYPEQAAPAGEAIYVGDLSALPLSTRLRILARRLYELASDLQAAVDRLEWLMRVADMYAARNVIADWSRELAVDYPPLAPTGGEPGDDNFWTKGTDRGARGEGEPCSVDSRAAARPVAGEPRD